ncbi:uncharacterized protein LOC124701746 [Lolium rigidum]|uniref:uncharacterized protein LOC124701746 n=1 Tax=Lolium rigidum TaxID=89674 RepID=UPI001F5D9555|nr:uncharacterized protein LOC124701746 [Lolium rigidum]XP_047089799.1 uncharacterized protein LOC124701746 [Lolium rigidum]XP_047089800.1 uncharacterized protein LOC124701746 [Lolium rigidum]
MSKVLERRNSFGATTPASSTSASDSSRKEEKPVPRYLRPSTGSCHDLCKHGHRNPSEEIQKFLGGRRKKLPTHLNNLALHGSIALDTPPKDARSRRNISLVKSSISLGEADRVVHKIKSANLRGAASSEHLVPRVSLADHKSVSSDGRKKQPVVAQRTSPNPKSPNGVPNFDKKAAMPVKGSKLPEKTQQEKARTVEKTLQERARTAEKTPREKARTAEKATTVKQSLVKRPASLPTKLNLIKKSSVSSQASSNLVSSKDKNTLKGRLTSSPAIITGKHTSNSGKAGRSPMRSSNANIDGKGGSDLLVTPLSIESDITASVKIQEDDVQDSCVTDHLVESTATELSADATEYAEKFRIEPEETSSEDGLDMSITSSSVESEFEAQDDVQASCIAGHSVESALAELPPSATEYVDKSGPTAKDACTSISEDEVECHENIEALAAELPVKSIIAQRSFDGQEVKAVITKSDLEHMQPEQNAIANRALTDEDIQTDDAALYQLSERSDVHDSALTESTLESDVDGVEVNAGVESLVIESREDVGAHEDTDDAAPCQSSKDVECDADGVEVNAGVESVVTESREDVGAHETTDDAAPCQSSKELTAVQNADVSSETEADEVKISGSVQSVIIENGECMGAHEDLQGLPELGALDEEHADPEYCLDCSAGNVTENVNAAEIVEVKTFNGTPHCQSILETSSYGELMEQPKPMLTEPIQTDVVTSVHNDGTFEQDELKSMIVAQQLLEELSDDENYEEYDYELVELDESDAEHEGITINPNIDESSKEKGQWTKRISSLHPDEASTTPYKLKFKRGKIVELTPDSNGPRRLIFRRRVASEVANGDGQLARKIYKRNIRNNGVPAEPDLESPGVKLRHQDAQDKKDAQGLFNNVIEETASKLVESRKSKVKALVGAFETVILLQDGNPSPSTPQASISPYSVHNDDEKTSDEPV